MAGKKKVEQTDVVAVPVEDGPAVVVGVDREDAYWRENYAGRPYVTAGEDYAVYQPAYVYAVEAAERHQGKRFEDVEADLRRDWEKSHRAALPWEKARGPVRDAFERTIQLREEQMHVSKRSVEAGEVRVRKEVVTERKTLDVPVEREEVYIERRPASGRAAAGDLKAEELRVGVRKEEVQVEKEAVVREEVTVGKRKVADQKTVSADLKKEELRVEETGEVKAKTTRGSAGDKDKGKKK